MVALLSAANKNPPSTLSPAISSQAQLEQLSSVAAGTRYLKNKCNRSDLPADETIYRAAVNVGNARGWGNIDVATLSQNSDRLYQQLLQDSTPEATQCSQFNPSARAIYCQLAQRPSEISSARRLLCALLFLFRLLVNFSARPVLQRREGKGRAVEAEDRHILLDLLHHQIGQG